MSTIIQSIGISGRDFSTLKAWRDALPANLVTDGNSYIGQCYNDSEFTESTQLLFNQTTDSTHTITLTTAIGQSFRDNIGVRTNALTYNQTNGVAFTSTTSSGATLNLQTSFMTISNLQIKSPNDNISSIAVLSGNVVINDCIIQGTENGNTLLFNTTGSVKISNCLIYSPGADAKTPTLLYNYYTTSAYFCTFVGSSDHHAEFVLFDDTGLGESGIFENCAFFGANTFIGGASHTPSFTTCATDLASPPAGITGSLTYNSQFIGTTSSTPDFRLKVGTDLRNVGTDDYTNGSVDISGVIRPQGIISDIGCWESIGAIVTGQQVW